MDDNRRFAEEKLKAILMCAYRTLQVPSTAQSPLLHIVETSVKLGTKELAQDTVRFTKNVAEKKLNKLYLSKGEKPICLRWRVARQGKRMVMVVQVTGPSWDEVWLKEFIERVRKIDQVELIHQSYKYTDRY